MNRFTFLISAAVPKEKSLSLIDSAYVLRVMYMDVFWLQVLQEHKYAAMLQWNAMISEQCRLGIEMRNSVRYRSSLMQRFREY